MPDLVPIAAIIVRAGMDGWRDLLQHSKRTRRGLLVNPCRRARAGGTSAGCGCSAAGCATREGGRARVGCRSARGSRRRDYAARNFKRFLVFERALGPSRCSTPSGMCSQPSASAVVRRAACGSRGFEFGRVDDGLLTLLREARQALGKQDSPLLGACSVAWRPGFTSQTGRSSARDLGEQAIAIVRRTGDRATLASTLNAGFITRWDPENSIERLKIASDVVALGEEVRDRELVLHGHVWQIVTAP
jgi:hypothetical protein